MSAPETQSMIDSVRAAGVKDWRRFFIPTNTGFLHRPPGGGEPIHIGSEQYRIVLQALGPIESPLATTPIDEWPDRERRKIEYRN